MLPFVSNSFKSNGKRSLWLSFNCMINNATITFIFIMTDTKQPGLHYSREVSPRSMLSLQKGERADVFQEIHVEEYMDTGCSPCLCEQFQKHGLRPGKFWAFADCEFDDWGCAPFPQILCTRLVRLIRKVYKSKLVTNPFVMHLDRLSVSQCS